MNEKSTESDEPKRKTPSEILSRHLIEAEQREFRGNAWGKRHVGAWIGPKEHEQGLRDAIYGWAMIAESHLRRYGSPIGDDGVLGPAWKQIGEGLIDLLNGEIGALDGGSLDGLIRTIAKESGAPFED
jgi:hypothetical protein